MCGLDGSRNHVLDPHRKGTIERDMPAVDILKVTHKGAARGDAACLPPLLWTLLCFFSSVQNLAIIVSSLTHGH